GQILEFFDDRPQERVEFVGQYEYFVHGLVVVFRIDSGGDGLEIGVQFVASFYEGFDFRFECLAFELGSSLQFAGEVVDFVWSRCDGLANGSQGVDRRFLRRAPGWFRAVFAKSGFRAVGSIGLAGYRKAGRQSRENRKGCEYKGTTEAEHDFLR